MILESFENPYPNFVYDHDLTELVHEVGIRKSYPANTTFMAPYNDRNQLSFIHKGKCRVFIASEDGREKILAILKENAFFGSTQMITGINDNLYIISDTPVVLYNIDQHTFIRLMDSSRIFRDTILHQLSNLFFATTKQLESCSFKTCKVRLYENLLKNMDEDSSPDGVWFPLKSKNTQSDLAKIIGSSRYTVTKLISELCEDGVIKIINNKIEIRPQGDF